MANIAYLLLGSNLGDKQKNLQKAITLLLKETGHIIKHSTVYETLPWGVQDQPRYVNQVLELETSLSPQALLEKTNSIEKSLGRQRRIRWESRIIDIDILYYNELIIQTETLSIPHPQLSNRRFTLVPLVEIAPHFMHPVLKLSNEELLRRCTDQLSVIPIQEI